MIAVGVTGNIGSGKSTVCKIFEQLGVSVYYADDRAKQLYDENQALKNGLIAIFGLGVYDELGRFDKRALQRALTTKPNLLPKLNALVHPIVFDDFAKWRQQKASEGFDYVLKEAAILFESGADKMVDAVIGVLAEKEIRISRAMLRDNIDLEVLNQRMQSQWPEQRWKDRCDWLIVNDGHQSLIEQVCQIHQLIMKRATLYRF